MGCIVSRGHLAQTVDGHLPGLFIAGSKASLLATVLAQWLVVRGAVGRKAISCEHPMCWGRWRGEASSCRGERA